MRTKPWGSIRDRFAGRGGFKKRYYTYLTIAFTVKLITDQ
jgi:hypothetical protein